jgi:DMSO reductase family type II enzyme heme b subunit
MHALSVKGTLPLMLEDARWAQADRTTVRLRHAVASTGEWAAPPTVQFVVVETLASDDTVAFRLTWDDPTESVNASPDALALLLKPSRSAGDVVTLQAWPYVGGPMLDVCSWRADTNQAVEGLATSFHRALTPARNQVSISSTARYADGRWQLMLHRSMESEPPGSAVIGAEPLTSVAFAVWDGETPEARAISPWIDLALPDRH